MYDLQVSKIYTVEYIKVPPKKITVDLDLQLFGLISQINKKLESFSQTKF